MRLHRVFRIAALIIAVFAVEHVFSRALFVEDYGYVVDIPEGWEILDREDLSKVAFTDPAHAAVFQILSLEGSKFNSARSLYSQISQGLRAKGEPVEYRYSGMDSVFAEVAFTAGTREVQGFFLIINGETYDFALLSYAPTDTYEKNHDFLLSALDSFASEPEQLIRPGPVTQLLSPFPNENGSEQTIQFLNESFTISTDEADQMASQLLIEREARILASYGADRAKAWERYYRIIYRDSYSRLEETALQIGTVFGMARTKFPDVPRLILQWLQGQEYHRTGTLSDLLAPLTSVSEARGDCDSRGIVYSILLDYFGIDSILLVSSEYGHSVSAVDTIGTGARYDYEGKAYLVAELTDDVDIGLIAADMADPAGWQPIRLAYRF